MKKLIGLTETDLSRIVKRVIKENDVDERMVDADNYADELFWEMNNHIQGLFYDFLRQVNINEIVSGYQDKFIDSEYGQYINDVNDYELDNIKLLMSYKRIDIDEVSSHLTDSLLGYIEHRD